MDEQSDESDGDAHQQGFQDIMKQFGSGSVKAKSKGQKNLELRQRLRQRRNRLPRFLLQHQESSDQFLHLRNHLSLSLQRFPKSNKQRFPKSNKQTLVD